MIRAVGVVVPAHNEEDLLPACLAAVLQAADELEPMPVRVIVVADACTDKTAQLARDSGATVVTISTRSVGAARQAGMHAALQLLRHLDPAEVWLATTDADTVVPPGWLSRQLRYAEQGWDAVIGTVTVTDWTEHGPAVQARFQQRYCSAGGSHPHVHGANLGFTASAYRAAGGFGLRRTAEDHALAEALDLTSRRVLRTTQVNVVTSARRHARAPQGFSHLLSTLATAD